MEVPTSRSKWIIIATAIIVLVVLFIYCGSARAADSPRPPVNTWPRNYVTFGVLYTSDLGGQIGYAYQFRSGIVINPALFYVQSDGASGTTVAHDSHGRSFAVPYSTPANSHGGVGFTVMIPLDRHDKR